MVQNKCAYLKFIPILLFGLFQIKSLYAFDLRKPLFTKKEEPLPTDPCEQLKTLVVNVPSDQEDKKNPRTLNNDSFLVYKQTKQFPNGKILYQNHNAPFSANSLHPLWSATKPITTAMAARAIQLGDLKLDDKIVDILGQRINPQRRAELLNLFLSYTPKKEKFRKNEDYFKDITVKNVMEMTTGIDWFEHEDKGMDETSSMLMLYGPGVRNTLDFALSLPMAYKPGRAWNYSSGNTVILAGLLSAMYGADYQKKLLFNDLHMDKAYVEKDVSKNTVGSSFSYLTPLDMLKLGELYLNKGCLKKVSGKCSEQDQFFPPGWTDYVQTLIPAYNNPETDAAYVKKEMMVYGTSFAVNKGVPSRGIPQPFPEAPADMYFAAGHFGQLIIILPTDKTIIVRTAYDESYWKHVGKMAKLTLECFKDNKVKSL